MQIDDDNVKTGRLRRGEIAAPQGRIPSLDGLRACSIVLVLASHAIQGTHSFLFRLFFLHSDLGVRVFFVISGYLITTLLLRERAESGGISLRMFYIRRTLRILPAFCLFVGCVAILNAAGIIHVPAPNWAYILTYTVNFDPLPPWAIGHLWSLSVEEQFYLLWPLVMKFARPSMATGVATVSVFAAMVMRATGLQWIDPALHYAFPFVCGPIAMGCLLAIHAPRVKRLIAGSGILSGELIFLFAVPLMAWLDALDATTPNSLLRLTTNCLLALCVARLVFVPAGKVGRILNSAPLVRLGKLSYSLYLFQQLFLDSMSTAPIPIPFPLNLAAALAAAVVCYQVMEVRFLSLRSRFRRTPVVPAEPAFSSSNVA